MAKYGLGESNAIENIFSNKPSDVSTFASAGDRVNNLINSPNRTK